MADADAGTCNPASLNRWYYNASSKSCEQFQYSGCGGNFNNFLSNVKNQRDIHSTDLQKVEAHFSGVVSRNFRALEKRKIGYMAIYIQYNIDSLSKKAVFGTNINLLK